MRRSTDGQYMLLTLEDGVFYDERERQPGLEGGSFPMVQGRFDKNLIRIDMSGLGLKRTDEDLFKDHYKMLTMGQLAHTEDSLHQRLDERWALQQHYLRNSLAIMRDSVEAGDIPATPNAPMGTPTAQQQYDLYEAARTMVRNNIDHLTRGMEEQQDRGRMIAKFRIEWHRKLMLAFACVVFFFIGAPLGAIIRKGGMGMPAVFAIVFFLVFHVISFSTEKLVVAGELQAWPGMWISTLVLLPIGAWLTWSATTDSPLFDRDAYYRGWDRLRARFRRHEDPTTVQ
jgi:lipopolysaccharide export system permease protein